MTITAAEYPTVQRARHSIREALTAAFENSDPNALPTTSRVAPLLSIGLKGNGSDTRPASYNQSNLLRFPRMLGLPGCFLQNRVNPEGLPIGLQLIGSWFADKTNLNAGFGYQRTTDWHICRPSIASP